MRTSEQFQAFTERMMLHPKRGIIGEETCCLGLAGELGEVAAAIPGDRALAGGAALTKELGDVLWYVTALAWHYDTKVQALLDDATPTDYRSPASSMVALMLQHFGVAIDHVKKVSWHGAEPDAGLVLRSLRDGLGAYKALAQAFGLTINEIMGANIAKLRARHGESFSGGAGDRSSQEAA